MSDANDPAKKRIFLGRGQLYLMGLVHGHWYIKDKDKNEVVMVAVEKDHPEANIVGISVVVPARKILEVLNHPELVPIRQASDDRYSASFGTTASD